MVCVETLRHVDAPDLQGTGEVLDERGEERRAGGSSGAIDDGVEQLLRALFGGTAVEPRLAIARDHRHRAGIRS